VKHDLYQTLGVPLDATAADVKRAYRKVAKHAHPDMPGGSRARFALVKTAFDTLSDKARRQHYDETGEIEDKPVDNKLSGAMQCLAAALEAAIASCEANGEDPETVNIPARIKSWINSQIADTGRQIAQAQTGLAKNQSLAKRFSAGIMVQIMEGRIAMIRERIGHMQRNIETGKDALDLMAGLEYRADTPLPRQMGMNTTMLSQLLGRL
jgi:curved DNA-binding protein CbpA